MKNITVESYLRYVKQFLVYVKELNSEDMGDEEIIRGFLARYSGKSPNTYANVLKALRIFLREFVGRSIIGSFRFPPRGFTPKQVPSKEEIKRFYEAIPSLKYKAMFLLLASSGLRLSEVLGLRVADLDFENKSIKVTHFSRTKRAFTPFFNEEAKQALLSYIKSRGLAPEDPLFKGDSNRHLKGFEKARRKTGIEITPQVLRIWFACEMGRLGVPDRYVDAFCGRVPRSILGRHYTDYTPERLKEIYDRAGLTVLGERARNYGA